MIPVIIPMAGEGRRFTEACYDQPKPLIDVAGKPMIERVMECLRPTGGARFVLLSRMDVGDLGAEIVPVDLPTRGAVDTLLYAEGHVPAGPVLVANCDQYITADVDEFLTAAQGADAAIMVFNSTNPHHSYVRIAGGLVTTIAEKRVISDNAVVGVYWFADSVRLFDTCRRVLRGCDPEANGEHYLSSVLGLMVADDAKVATFEVDVRDKHMLGTPEELRIFLDKVADGRVTLPSDDEWTDLDEDATRGECSRCGEVKRIRYITDPFLAEVYPEEEDEPEWLCGPCWQQRKDDV